MSRLLPPPDTEVYYPEGDGKPMGETDLHREEMQRYLIDVLEDVFEGDPSVYVSGNNFLYYREGDPSACVSPDAYVVRGPGREQRRIFKVWEEGATPALVFEVTSRSTEREDKRGKHAIYEQELAVPEYFLYDIERDWIAERLRGYRLGADGRYERIEPDPEGRLFSEQLGLYVLLRDDHVRFQDPATGAIWRTRRERVEAERARADEAQARADQAQARADEAQARAEAERARADAERSRAAAFEAELARLREELEGRRGAP